MDLQLDAVKHEVMTLPEKARTYAILDATTYVQAAAFLKQLKTIQAKIDELWNPVIHKAHEAHKAACVSKKTLEAPVLEAETIVKVAMAHCQQQEEAKRRAAEARLNQEVQLQQAIEAEDAGDVAGAEAILNGHQVVAPVIVPNAVLKVDGITAREHWYAEVFDFKTLVEEVAKRPELLPLLSVNQTALNQMARALKEALMLPGVMVGMRRVMNARQG